MASYIVSRSDAVQEGPQPFDPSRHMRQVADLVATVFAEELDARGRYALREMQVVGRLSPMLGDTLNAINDRYMGYQRLKKVIIVQDEWTVENNFLTLTMKMKRNVVMKAYEEKLEALYSTDMTVDWA